MNYSRRRFLKTAGIGASALAAPGWVLVPEFAEAAEVNKDELADVALAAAKSLGASYADIRINRYRQEEIYTREQQVRNVLRSESFGFGVRTLVRGSWGFVMPRAGRWCAPATMRISRRMARASLSGACARLSVRCVPGMRCAPSRLRGRE